MGLRSIYYDSKKIKDRERLCKRIMLGRGVLKTCEKAETEEPQK